MKIITFKGQIILGIVLTVLGNVLAFNLNNGIFSNIAWIIYGLLFLLNPVYPERCTNEKSGKCAARIAGIICILFGLLIRFIPAGTV